tara:strand:+ start:17864 stop:18790 length:927 start_codon:yes stop_codon:yes gene_type:complete
MRTFILKYSLVILVFLIIGLCINNFIINLINSGIKIDLKWLFEPSGFEISESVLNFSSKNNYIFALLTGWLNSLKVIFCGLILASLIGISMGILRITKNIFLNKIASLYISVIRQIPLLIQLLFWYFVAFLNLPKTPINPLRSLILLSKQGVFILGINLSPEFCALLIGLSIYTSAAIAELVRGGLESVYRGQWEAYRSLGLSEGEGIRKIIFPQALPAILPALTSQYLNLAKNSTLAIAIGYPDIYAISDTTITQTGRAIEGFVILLLGFTTLNLIISTIMEKINRSILNKLINRNPTTSKTNAIKN